MPSSPALANRSFPGTLLRWTSSYSFGLALLPHSSHKDAAPFHDPPSYSSTYGVNTSLALHPTKEMTPNKPKTSLQSRSLRSNPQLSSQTLFKGLEQAQGSLKTNSRSQLHRTLARSIRSTAGLQFASETSQDGWEYTRDGTEPRRIDMPKRPCSWIIALHAATTGHIGAGSTGTSLCLGAFGGPLFVVLSTASEIVSTGNSGLACFCLFKVGNTSSRTGT